MLMENGNNEDLENRPGFVHAENCHIEATQVARSPKNEDGPKKQPLRRYVGEHTNHTAPHCTTPEPTHDVDFFPHLDLRNVPTKQHALISA